MRGGLSASRRFYCTFYRWNINNTTTHPGCRGLAATASRAGEDGPVATTDRDASALVRRSARPRANGRHLKLAGQRAAGERPEPDMGPRIKSLRDAPVLTASEKPFDTFAAWEMAVRYRSEAGVLLQIAVPTPQVREAQRKLGDSLQSLQEQKGARIELGSVSHTDGAEKMSMTISGTWAQVAATRDHVLVFKPPRWLDAIPQSEAQIPRSSLVDWQRVMRESRGDYRKVEVAVPPRLETYLGGLISRRSFSDGFHAAFTERRANTDTNNEASLAHRPTMIIAGSTSDVSTALDVVGSLQGTAKPMFAHDQASGKVHVENASSTNVVRSDAVEQQGKRHRSRDSVLRDLKTQGVTSPTAKPFDTFAPWEQAVRQRSEGGLDVEFAIPSVCLRETCERYGPQLKLLEEKFSTRVQLGPTVSRGPLELSSVTLSGRIDQIIAAARLLFAHRPSSWMSSAATPYHLRPSREMRPWEPVLRQCDIEMNYRQIEVVLPPHDASVLRKRYAFEAHAARKGASFELRPALEDWEHGNGSIAGQPVLISGTNETVWRIWRSMKLREQGIREMGERAELPAPDNSKAPYGCRMVLRIPLGPSGESFGRTLHTPENSTNLMDKYNVRLWRGKGLVYLKGDDEVSVRQAFQECQSVLDRASESTGSPKIGIEIEMIEVKNGEQPHKLPRKYPASLQKAELDRRPINRDMPDGSHGEVFRLWLEMPSEPSGETVVRAAIAKRKSQHQIRFSVHYGSRLLLRGPDEARVRQAAQYLQTNVDEECERAGILPRQLRELSATLKSTETRSPEMAERLRENMKLVLSTLTHPVVLVTARARAQPGAPGTNKEDTLNLFRGITVSSFNSVSLGPRSIVSFNIRTPSRTWDAIRESERFKAQMLVASPEAAALAHAFTLPYERPDEPFRRAQALGAYVGGNYGDFDCRLNLRGATLCNISAKVLHDKCVQVGDHIIVVAEALNVGFTDGQSGQEIAINAAGLSYARRQYRGVGNEIEMAAIPEAAPESVATAAGAAEAQAPVTSGITSTTSMEDEGEDHDGALLDDLQEGDAEAPETRGYDEDNVAFFEQMESFEDDDTADENTGREVANEPISESAVTETNEVSSTTAQEDELPAPASSESRSLVEDSDAAQEADAEAPGEADADAGTSGENKDDLPREKRPRTGSDT